MDDNDKKSFLDTKIKAIWVWGTLAVLFSLLPATFLIANLQNISEIAYNVPIKFIFSAWACMFLIYGIVMLFASKPLNKTFTITTAIIEVIFTLSMIGQTAQKLAEGSYAKQEISAPTIKGNPIEVWVAGYYRNEEFYILKDYYHYRTDCPDAITNIPKAQHIKIFEFFAEYSGINKMSDLKKSDLEGEGFTDFLLKVVKFKQFKKISGVIKDDQGFNYVLYECYKCRP